MIHAKLNVVAASTVPDPQVHCELSAGGSSDESWAVLVASNMTIIEGLTERDMVMALAVNLPSADTAEVVCRSNHSGGIVAADYATIIATRVESITVEP